MRPIKIYGERNTGTNYLEQLLLLNYEVKSLKYLPDTKVGFLLKYETCVGLFYEMNKNKFLGWKHGKQKINSINKYADQELVVIGIIKNPYSFIKSLNKRPYHNRKRKNLDLKTFVSKGWQTIIRDNCMFKKYKTPVDLWNDKSRSLLSMSSKINKDHFLLKYEDLVSDPEKMIMDIGKKTGLELKNKKFKNLLSSTKDENLTYGNYRNYYIKEKWRMELNKETLTLINERLDQELMDILGYEMIKP